MRAFPSAVCPAAIGRFAVAVWSRFVTISATFSLSQILRSPRGRLPHPFVGCVVLFPELKALLRFIALREAETGGEWKETRGKYDRSCEECSVQWQNASKAVS